MRIKDYTYIYFIGIGGIGMSALARWFLHAGKKIYGYDRTPTSLTKTLISEGMDIHFEDNIEHITKEMNPENTLVIFTPAIPAEHKEYNYFKEEKFTILKRSQVLGLLTNNFKNIAVAGTHGKTTVSSMIAHIIKSAKIDMVGFLGGITINENSNLLIHGEANENTWMVVEADEYDRSFLQLHPTIAVVTSSDADHLDIYKSHALLRESFTEFINQIKPQGHLIINQSVVDLASSASHIDVNTYALNRGQFFVENVHVENGNFEFNLIGPDLMIENIKLGIPGFYNIENAIAAARAALLIGIAPEKIASALASFQGIKRRFEYIIKQDNLVFVDDYAHHPAEIESFLTSLRKIYAEKKISVIFQPHLYSRTRDFLEGFSKSLSLADEVYLMDIYPARELPIPGVTSDILVPGITCPVIRCQKKNLLEKINKKDIEVLATVGAGDIDSMIQPLKEKLMR